MRIIHILLDKIQTLLKISKSNIQKEEIAIMLYHCVNLISKMDTPNQDLQLQGGKLIGNYFYECMDFRNAICYYLVTVK